MKSNDVSLERRAGPLGAGLLEACANLDPRNARIFAKALFARLNSPKDRLDEKLFSQIALECAGRILDAPSPEIRAQMFRALHAADVESQGDPRHLNGISSSFFSLALLEAFFREPANREDISFLARRSALLLETALSAPKLLKFSPDHCQSSPFLSRLAPAPSLSKFHILPAEDFLTGMEFANPPGFAKSADFLSLLGQSPFWQARERLAPLLAQADQGTDFLFERLILMARSLDLAAHAPAGSEAERMIERVCSSAIASIAPEKAERLFQFLCLADCPFGALAGAGSFLTSDLSSWAKHRGSSGALPERLFNSCAKTLLAKIHELPGQTRQRAQARCFESALQTHSARALGSFAEALIPMNEILREARAERDNSWLFSIFPGYAPPARIKGSLSSLFLSSLQTPYCGSFFSALAKIAPQSSNSAPFFKMLSSFARAFPLELFAPEFWELCAAADPRPSNPSLRLVMRSAKGRKAQDIPSSLLAGAQLLIHHGFDTGLAPKSGAKTALSAPFAALCEQSLLAKKIPRAPSNPSQKARRV